MLQRFLEQQPAVTAALLSHEVRKNEKDVSEADITAAEEIVTAMKPMKIATVVMEGENSHTVSSCTSPCPPDPRTPGEPR